MLTPAVVHAAVAAGATAAILAAMFEADYRERHGVVAHVSRAPPDVAATVAPTIDAKERKRKADRERMKRKRAGGTQIDLFQVSLAVDNDKATVARDASDPPSLKEKSPHTPLKENNPSPKIDDDDDRSSVVSMISTQAKQLTAELRRIARIDPDLRACPPGWCEADLQVQSWLSAGWSSDSILAGAKATMARKRDGPPDTVSYFGKQIARVIAQVAKPPPIAEVFHECSRPPRRTNLDVLTELATECRQGNRGETNPPPPRLLSSR